MTSDDLAGRVAVVGSLNMDLVVTIPRVPEAGETLSGKGFAQIPGGKGANQAVACARMGASVSHIGRVGADPFGAQLRQTLAADGIDVGHVGTDPAAATGVAMILVEESSGQNRIVLAPGANATLDPSHLDDAAETIKDSALMIVQMEIPMASVERAVQIAKGAGKAVLLNPAPAQMLSDSLWAQIDTLIPNESEASLLSGVAVTDPASAAQAAAIFRGRGVRRVLMTLGAQGVLIADDDGVRHLPAIPVKAVDTTAAGDTFIGGFAAGLVEGMSVDRAAQLGQQAASLCVLRPGAQPSIPYRSEVGFGIRGPEGTPLTT